jgi:hypothetical protein
MGNTLEVILTIIAMSFWILFPIGMFMSVSRLDKNTDQVVKLEHLRTGPVEEEKSQKPIRDRVPDFKKHFDWHHPILNFRRWLHQP